MSKMFAEDGPVMTFLAPFITEPIGYDRVLDVTVRNGKKIKVVQYILHQIV